MNSDFGSVLVRKLPLIGYAVAALTMAWGCHGGATALDHLDDSRALAADLRVQFNRAADASNRAVMADTDETSSAFASDADKTLEVVDRDVASLTPVLGGLGFTEETRLLQDFGKHLASYRELDRNILTLAVENTNLKAQRLSFGPAQQAADAVRDSLASLPGTAATKDRCHVEELVAQATVAVREIQVLQAPHIAESDDSAMTRMENQMAVLDTGARTAIQGLSELALPNTHPALVAALSALDHFKEISSQIVTLSRRNSNVRSLELSLRAKPALTASCDDSLHALQDALAKEGSKATR